MIFISAEQNVNKINLYSRRGGYLDIIGHVEIFLWNKIIEAILQSILYLIEQF